MCALWLAFIALQSSAQRTRIEGRVTDGTTLEPLPFVTVAFQGGNVGTVTDTLGYFTLETGRAFDSLVVSLVGYHKQVLPVAGGTTEYIDVELFASAIQMDMFTVRPGENPAFAVLRKVIARKEENRPEHLSAYRMEAYHRVRFDLNNFTDKIKRNVLLRPFDYLWDYGDTTTDGVRYLPILLTESSEEHYYRRDPPARKQVVKGRRVVKFFKAPRISAFVEDMYVDPDLYQNYVELLEHPFPSPINDHYRRNYDYLLTDSGLVLNGRTCYHITFKPKGRSDVAFTGDMYIDEATYALVQADLAFSIEANINFVRNYWIRQNYGRVDDRQWFLLKSQVLADFTVVENSAEMTGFYGRKTTEFRNIRMDEPLSDRFYAGVDAVVIEDGALERDSAFWQAARGDTLALTPEEKGVEEMVGRMNTDPRWVRLMNLGKMVGSGWLPWGPVDLGHVFTFYSFNRVEGPRFKLGLRTNERFSKRIVLGGHVAYGLWDERFKGGGDVLLHLARAGSKRWSVGANYRYDLVQQGRTGNMIPLDHILTSAIRISGREQRMLVDDRKAYAERQWCTGFTTRVGVYRKEQMALGGLFQERRAEGDTVAVAGYTSAGAELVVRYAWGAKNLPGSFHEVDRSLYFLKYPMVTFELVTGFKDLWGGQFDLRSYKLKMEHQVRMNKAGFLNILAEGGAIDGSVPYPLLHTPDGNPLVLNDNHAFNTMNYLEFVSDRYVSLQLEHHFEGLLLNKVPWLRRLKLREFLLAKGYYGTWSEADRTGPYLLGEGMRTLDRPYTEVGFGIENILKLARVDFLWRLDHLDGPKVLPFVVKPSFYLRF
ncbi:MAG: carboxypeptidase-like regulatory domain-containing protein [Flavobacteriales bacterium]|nr:carboxypeptidase-like regulatory domain-containing protein [Flavobacteriales bacterium]